MKLKKIFLKKYLILQVVQLLISQPTLIKNIVINMEEERIEIVLKDYKFKNLINGKIL